MTPLSWIALLLALLLAAGGALLWITLRRGSTRETERADIPRVELPGEASSRLSAEDLKLEARSAEPGDAAAKNSPNASARSGTGTLRVRVIDEQTHAPVPKLGLHVYRERGGDKDLADGTTDAQGRAAVRDLEANTILVRTQRKPPYAESTGGAWLVAGATK